MRVLAIGDIHGCFKALTTLVEYVNVQRDDIVVTLGDYVDRGPDSNAVVDWLVSWSARHRLIMLRGNHEIMMLKARENGHALEVWKACGGDATLRSYAHLDEGGDLADVPDAHWDFIGHRLRASFETESHFFVHAGAHPGMPIEDQTDDVLYWEQFIDPVPHESGKVMVCGHTSQKSGEPVSVGHAICIDTWAHGDGWLTCLDADSGQYWQANEAGATRKAFIRPPDKEIEIYEVT